jgi:hypothetical protein
MEKNCENGKVFPANPLCRQGGRQAVEFIAKSRVGHDALQPAGRYGKSQPAGSRALAG